MQYVKNKNRANAFLNNNNKTLVNSIFMHYLIKFNMGRFHKKSNILKKTNRKPWADEIAFLPETLDQNGQMDVDGVHQHPKAGSVLYHFLDWHFIRLHQIRQFWFYMRLNFWWLHYFEYASAYIRDRLIQTLSTHSEDV